MNWLAYSAILQLGALGSGLSLSRSAQFLIARAASSFSLLYCLPSGRLLLSRVIQIGEAGEWGFLAACDGAVARSPRSTAVPQVRGMGQSIPVMRFTPIRWQLVHILPATSTL